MTCRNTQIGDFLADAGFGGWSRNLLAGDASARTYYRLSSASKTAVLMDAPPGPAGKTEIFAAMTKWLIAQGFSAPEIYAARADQGLLVLEDLGDDLLSLASRDRPQDEDALYSQATELLAQLHRIEAPECLPDGSALEPYDLTFMQEEIRRVLDWYVPGATGTPASPDMIAEFRSLIAACFGRPANRRGALVLRDYHSENLLWLPERAAHARIGLLDYQDALNGHPAYDLVSLLEDARRDTSPELRTSMMKLYLAAAGCNHETFRADYAALGAQRSLKNIGNFARLCIRDGKPRYVGMMPRLWSHLQRNLAHPALAPLRAWVDKHLPPPEAGVLDRIRAAAA